MLATSGTFKRMLCARDARVLVVSLILSGCFDFVQDKYGLEDQRCYPDGTCLQGLRCSEEHVCVDPCTIVTCSGHGDCFYDDERTRCLCDSGYRAVGEECVGPGQQDEECFADQTCENDLFCDASSICIACEGQVAQVCEAGNVYWVDSCGRRNERLSNCGYPGCNGETLTCARAIWSTVSLTFPPYNRMWTTAGNADSILFTGEIYDTPNNTYEVGAWRYGSQGIEELYPGSGTAAGVSNTPGESYTPVAAEDARGTTIIFWAEQSRLDGSNNTLFAPAFRRIANKQVVGGLPCIGGPESLAPTVSIAKDDTFTYLGWASTIEGGSTIWKTDGANCELLTNPSAGWRASDLVEWIATGRDGSLFTTGQRVLSADVRSIFVAQFAGDHWEDISPSVPGAANVRQAHLVMADDMLTLAFIDAAIGNRDVFTFGRRAGVWSPLGAADGNLSRSSVASNYLDMIADVSQAPIVAWREGDSGGDVSLTVRRWSGSVWDAVASSPDGLSVTAANGVTVIGMSEPDSGGFISIFQGRPNLRLHRARF